MIKLIRDKNGNVSERGLKLAEQVSKPGEEEKMKQYFIEFLRQYHLHNPEGNTFRGTFCDT